MKNNNLNISGLLKKCGFVETPVGTSVTWAPSRRGLDVGNTVVEKLMNWYVENVRFSKWMTPMVTKWYQDQCRYHNGD